MDIVIYILTLLISVFLLVIAYWKAGIFALLNTLLSVIVMSVIINDGGITYTQSAYTGSGWTTTTVNYIPVDVALLPFVFLLMISLFGVARGLRRD